MKYIHLILAMMSFVFTEAQTLQNVESVEYDEVGNRFFVSNSNNIIARNNDASLSFFGEGAATAGMEVMGNTLFAVDGGTIKGYDLTTGVEVMSVALPGAVFLNGMTNDGSENLYVTDFSLKKIYKVHVADFSTPSAEVILEDTESTPNGIIYDEENNRLIFVTWGNNATIKAMDLSNNTLSTLTTTPYGNIDGIDEDNEGNYYISYWSSGTHISKYDANFADPPQTITVSGLSSPADICYAKAIDTLAIPHSGNKLTFIDFNEVTSVKEPFLAENLRLQVYPNPMQENSRIQFYLETPSEVSLRLYDEKSQLLAVLMEGKQVNGQHQILLQDLGLPKGILFLHLAIASDTKVFKLFNF